MMRKSFLSFVLLLSAACSWAAGRVERPKLVVGFVVDQMRWDYLYHYYEDYRSDGLRRLLDEGFSYANTLINYVPTVTAIGHASIYTGSTPALHGIAGNGFLEKGRYKYCVGDESVKGVGTESRAGQMSPRNCWANGLGDQIRLATNFEGHAWGVALKDRAAILPAGHAADAAYWYDNSVGGFVSSTYYMDALPKWVENFNKQHKHKEGYDPKLQADGVTLTLKMAQALIENEPVGRDNVTDLLAISISTTDAMSHQWGTRGEKNKEVFLQLDRDLAWFLKLLDERFGRGNYLFFLTADHGGAHNPNYMIGHKLPAGGWNGKALLKRVNDQLAQRFGHERLALDIFGDQFYLNHARIDSLGLDLGLVKEEVCQRILENDTLLYAIDCEKAGSATLPYRIREQIVNGYNRLRSGDIFIVPKSQMFSFAFSQDYVGTTHSEWNPYDAHIPFVLMGWHVKHGETNLETHITDIAPTICAMLHIQAPNSCIGDAREEHLNIEY